MRSENEAELQRKTVQAYRAFARISCPDAFSGRPGWPDASETGCSVGVIGSSVVAQYDAKENFKPKIRFIGVWDTVSAYGGPITEITRAIDNWFFPLSMPDYHLNENGAVRASRPRHR